MTGSHKRRDKRCHQAAPLLLAQFHHHLEANDLEIDERGDDITDDGPPIEEWDATTRSKRLRESLQGVRQGGGRVGVFKVSHVGGKSSRFFCQSSLLQADICDACARTSICWKRYHLLSERNFDLVW